MGRSPRLKQEKLAGKLKQIRRDLNLSQSELLAALGFEQVLDYKRVSEYELGTHEPPLRVLLAYARLGNVSVESIIDDNLDLDRRPGKKIRKKKRRAET